MGRNTESMGIVMIMGCIGLILAYLVGELNTDSIMIDDVLTATFTIAELQTVIILLFIIVGLILAARR